MGVETGLAVAGLAATGLSTAQSFINADKQRQLMAKASAEAAKAMADARKKLEVNNYAALGINKEPYELERQALISAGAQAIDAAREGDARGLAATAGRVQMAQNEGQREIASAMGTEMGNLDKLVAQEDSRLKDAGAHLDTMSAMGAQQAAADAQKAAAMSETQGWQGVGATLSQAAQMAPLFTGSSADKLTSKMEAGYNQAATSGTLNPRYIDPATKKAMSFEQAMALHPEAAALDKSNWGTLSGTSFEDMLKNLPYQKIDAIYKTGWTK
jgi:hypothetical protein